MKRIININLSGRVIPIEDSAYDTLKQYLDRLQQHFAREEGKDEILQDIENRIAELFNRQLEKGAGCITDSHVQDIVRQLGEPEEMDDDEPAPGASQSQQQKTSGSAAYNPDPAYYKTKHRKFFRDPDDQWVGGVCSGLAHYLNMDPMIIRLLVAILMFAGGTGFIAYIIVWLITPEAGTTAEKLEMRGQNVNIESIKSYSEGKTGFAPRRMTGIGEVISKLVRIGFKVVGFFIIACALLLLVGLLMSTLGLFAGWLTFPPLKTMIFEDAWKSNLLFVSGILLIAIPLMGITINLIRRLMGYKQSIRTFNTMLLALWILSLAAAAYTGIEFGQSFRYRKKAKENVILQVPAGRSLNVVMNEVDAEDLRRGWSWRWAKTDDMFFNMDDSLMIADVEVHFLPAQDSSFQMDMIRSAQGISRVQAAANADKLIYSWNFTDSTLRLSNAFTLASVIPWRNQNVKVFIKVPLNRMVTISPEVEGYTSDEDYFGYEDKRELQNNMRPVMFRMTADGLKATTLPDDSTRKIYHQQEEETDYNDHLPDEVPTPPSPPSVNNNSNNHQIRQQLAIFPLHIFEMVM